MARERLYGAHGKGRPPTSGTRHGNGRGWGGPAKGATPAAPDNPAPLYTPEVAALMSRRRGDPLVIASKAEREAATAMTHGTMYDVMTDPAEPGGNRVAAAVALDNRLNGMPVTRTVNVNADAAEGMTPDERRARIDELHRFVTGGGGSGTAAPADGGTAPSVQD